MVCDIVLSRQHGLDWGFTQSRSGGIRICERMDAARLTISLMCDLFCLIDLDMIRVRDRPFLPQLISWCKASSSCNPKAKCGNSLHMLQKSSSHSPSLVLDHACLRFRGGASKFERSCLVLHFAALLRTYEPFR
jgi:hypothetical protein